jgi:tetratricopeptide (TPR) repeat protein
MSSRAVDDDIIVRRFGGWSATPRQLMARGAAITGELRRLAVVLLGEAAAQAGPAPDAPDPEPLRRAVAPYGGRVEQLAGGATVIVLEADRQVATDQAAQAARCALAVAALAGGRPMALAMGRAASTSKLPEQDVIERAARLLAHGADAPGGAPGGRPPIALDEGIAGLLDARFDVIERAAGFSLCGERALDAGARTLLGRPTACVGRDWELGALAALLDECVDERSAHAAVVLAAAGMGKSRLASEFVSRVRQRPDAVAIWVGRGDSLRAGSTLDLLAQALRGALGIRGGEPLAERRDKIRARVAEHVPAGAQPRVAAFLAELVGAPFSADEAGGAALRAARQDARLMSEQMCKAWLDFLGAEAAARPVLLVLEDLHWGDFGTVRFIEVALRERRDLPWMVLALARPSLHEVFPKLWSERGNAQQIRLPGLGRKASERLVCQVLGDAVPAQVMERLVTRADGNAFYLEELIRAAAEGKEATAPDTVLAMVETRIAQLPEATRRVLRAASVFGEVCWEDGVAALLGGAAVGKWLDKLVSQEVLAPRPDGRLPGERELAFRHALLREGAYATLTEEDRRRGHRLAGEWLEQHGETDPMVLAGHFERGGEGGRAARYYLRAAQQAIHALDPQAMMTRAGLGLGCAPTDELRHALLGMRCEAALFSSPLLGVVMADAEELMRSAPPGGVPWAQAIVPYLTGLLRAGRMADVRGVVERLRTATPAPEAIPALAVAHLSMLYVLDLLGWLAEGNALVARFSEVLGPLEARTPRARFYWSLLHSVRSSLASEAPWDGLRHCEQMREVHEAIGGERVLVCTQLFGGMNLWFLGAHADAERMLLACPSADEGMGQSASVRRFCLTWLLAERGALDEARTCAAELAEAGRAHQDRLEESRGRWALAEVLRRSGDLEGAEREIAAARPLVPPIEQPGALATLARLRLAQGRAEEALAAAEDAAARYAAMGGCGLFRGAFVRLAHAEALHATGAHDAARRAIADARARVHAMADRIEDPAYRRSFLASVPEHARTLELASAWLGEPAPGASP